MVEGHRPTSLRNLKIRNLDVGHFLNCIGIARYSTVPTFIIFSTFVSILFPENNLLYLIQ
jgi:hypothetical protein